MIIFIVILAIIVLIGIMRGAWLELKKNNMLGALLSMIYASLLCLITIKAIQAVQLENKLQCPEYEEVHHVYKLK